MLTYLMWVLPAMLLGLWAQFQVKSAYARASKIAPQSALSGRAAALKILESNGLSNVGIEQAQGFMGDHYDPRSKVLRLSPDVYGGSSLAALGIAAHEAGHAIQDAQGYAPLVLRNGIVPLASIGSNLSFAFIFLGALLGSMGFVVLGIGLFSLFVVFQLINLPVEFNASSRAREILVSRGLISPAEEKTVAKVLNAAALTYVAATVSAVLTLLYYLAQMGLLGGHDD